MNPLVHRIYIISFVLIVCGTLVILIIMGIPYYQTSIEERFFHEQHEVLKPSGLLGHGLGIVGTLLIIIGVSSYMLRKRIRSLSRIGHIKHWLEFHIFLCSLGPVMVLFHTAFKFGGLVAISFWSMVAVVLSGVIGRFIYLQIPRSIEGRELSLNEVQEMQHKVKESLQYYALKADWLDWWRATLQDRSSQSAGGSSGLTTYLNNRKMIRKVRGLLKENKLERRKRKEIIRLIKNEITLSRKIDRLLLMQKLFRYWHVAHLPFALVMLFIVTIHVAVTLVFGYKWIF